MKTPNKIRLNTRPATRRQKVAHNEDIASELVATDQMAKRPRPSLLLRLIPGTQLKADSSAFSA
jgi:hypothetical protein